MVAVARKSISSTLAMMQLTPWGSKLLKTCPERLAGPARNVHPSCQPAGASSCDVKARAEAPTRRWRRAH
eukprot:8909692-Heterocapsa_arctica.AAC.1